MASRDQAAVTRSVAPPPAVVFFAAARLVVAAGFFAMRRAAVLVLVVAAVFFGALPLAATPRLSLPPAVPPTLAGGFELAVAAPRPYCATSARAFTRESHF